MLQSRGAATTREPTDAWTALCAGTLCVTLGGVTRGTPGGPDRWLFAALNHNQTTRALLRLPQQLGTPWVLPGLALAGFLTHRPHLAVTGAVALPLEKGAEVGVKKAFPRQRPSSVDPEVELRDDAPTEGPSYPSGHAAIAFTAVFLSAPYLPLPATVLGVAAAAVTSWVRVREGAHFPVDAVGGALLGVSVASALKAVFGRPTDPGGL